MTTPTIECREVTAETWPDFVALFEARGGPKYCYCLAWRDRPPNLDHDGRQEAMASRVRAGTPIGLLGYLDGAPVAWCSIAPRDTYARLGGEEYAPDLAVWSVVCFFLQRPLRGRGLSRALLDAAVQHARTRGADIVEAYPVDPDSPSYRFGGFVPLFRAAGFEERHMAGTRRHVMRLPVSPRGEAAIRAS
jgi:GNAT superfamily N-acetyltransferase